MSEDRLASKNSAAREGARTAVLQTWTNDMRLLAERPNVRVKIGGLGMPLYGFDLHRRPKPVGDVELAETWRVLTETTIALFGPSRCMFESNFPVDKQSTHYADLWNAFKRLSRGFTRAEKAALFFGTACETYRLPDILRAAEAVWQGRDGDFRQET
jgi:L-fuconolactonase